MDIVEKAHRQKSVELENIRTTMDGELNLKLFAYPVRKQIYPGHLAFVLYYEYETPLGYYSNWSSGSGFEPRFWINKDQDIESLVQSGKLILKSHSYQELRSKIIQMAIFDSASEDSKITSNSNIKWFKEHRDAFSKRSIRSNDFARDKKRLETVPQSKIIADTKTALKNENRLVPDVSAIKKFLKTRRQLKVG